MTMIDEHGIGPLRELLRLVRGYSGRAGGLVVLKLIATLCEAGYPVAVGFGVGAIVARDIAELWSATAALAGLVFIRIALSVAAHVVGKRLEIGLGLRLKRQVAEHVAATPGARDVGETLEIASEDTTTLSETGNVLVSLVVSSVVYVVVAVFLLAQSPLLGLVIMAAAPILAVGMPMLVKPLSARLARHRELAGGVSAMSVDAARGLTVLKGVGGERVFLDRFAAVSADMRTAGLLVAGVRAVIDGVKIALPALVVVVVLAVGLAQLASGAITSGQLVAFYGLALYLVAPVAGAVNAVQEVAPLLVAAERMGSLLRGEADTEPVAGVREGGADSGLSIEGIGERLVVVIGTDRESLPGLARRLAADAVGPGQVLVATGGDYIFEGTVREHFGSDIAPDVVRAASEAAQAQDVIRYLGGMDGLLADAGGNLSGGQRQRMALARALARRPEGLVLIEPTTAVDAATEAEISARLSDVRAGMITVVVADSPCFLRAAGCVVLATGEGLEAGTHDRLLERSAAYRSLMEEVLA